MGIGELFGPPDRMLPQINLCRNNIPSSGSSKTSSHFNAAMSDLLIIKFNVCLTIQWLAYFDPRFFYDCDENVAFLSVRWCSGVVTRFQWLLWWSYGVSFLDLSSLLVKVSIDNLCLVRKWVVAGFVGLPVFWFSCSVDEVVTNAAARIHSYISITWINPSRMPNFCHIWTLLQLLLHYLNTISCHSASKCVRPPSGVLLVKLDQGVPPVSLPYL